MRRVSELVDAELVKNYGARSLDEALALASEFLAQALELAEAGRDLERVTGELEEWRAEVLRRLEGK